jgi:steroid delta-isomerase-like uncharacterized protein
MTNSPYELIRHLYKEFWNERKLEVVDRLISESHALTSAHIFGTTVGPAAYKKQLQVFLTGFPDFRFTIDQTICEEDKIAVMWTFTGTHQGEFLGIAPTNKAVAITGITIHQVADRKILDSFAIWDAISMFRQLGIALPIKLETRGGVSTR